MKMWRKCAPEAESQEVHSSFEILHVSVTQLGDGKSVTTFLPTVPPAFHPVTTVTDESDCLMFVVGYSHYDLDEMKAKHPDICRAIARWAADDPEILVFKQIVI